MRESFVLIFALFAIASSNLDRNGFNIYKDHLRSRSDEGVDEAELGDRILYFYRAPLQAYLNQPADIPEYRKRATNIFKSQMLNNQGLGKRTSKAALSLMLQSKHDIDHGDDGHYCLYGK